MTSATLTVMTAKVPGLSGGDYVMDVKSSTIKLDEAHVPYGDVNLVVALPEDSILSQITPYSTQRIQITVNHSWVTPVRAAQTRSYDFLLHERIIDHEAGTLTLVGETDEALLIDRIKVSSTLERTYGLSVKTACEYALTQIGATLEAGAVDATLTTKTLEAVRTNLITNPSAETNTTGLAATNCTLTRVNTWAEVGSWSFQLSAPSSNDSFISPGTGSGTTIALGMVAGSTYTVSGTFRLAGTLSGTENARSRRIVVFYSTNSGSTYTEVASTPAANAIGATRESVTFTLPSNTTGAFIRYYHGHSTGTAFWDALMLTAGSDLIDYFDGSSTDPGLYSFAFTGTSHNSTSTKTNLANTDATIWLPGQSLDSWLEPILQASNRRLFCDEQRKWRLVDSGYTIDGLLSVSEGFNAKSGTDTMSRQKTERDVPTWFDHVAVHYKWTDSAGVVHEMWDFASSGSVKGYLVEVATPWPGPGAAAAVLARATGRGRTQLVTALTDFTATPGIPLITTLPGTPVQSGTTSSVEWKWSEGADEMTVSSRGLIDTPVNAWLFAVGAWSAATGAWSAATGTN